MSTFKEVRAWHQVSRAVLAQRDDLQPPTCMQDTEKTLEIYNEALYPTMQQQRMTKLVEDNTSPHNNDKIHASHRDHNLQIVGYRATEAEKEEIRDFIRVQTAGYRRGNKTSARS